MSAHVYAFGYSLRGFVYTTHHCCPAEYFEAMAVDDLAYWGITKNAGKVTGASTAGTKVDIPTLDVSRLQGNADELAACVQEIKQVLGVWVWVWLWLWLWLWVQL